MNWFLLIINLIGGLAIFLYGMNVMTEGLKAVAGNRLKLFLAGMTGNRWKALLAGTGITAIIQSSSVTTVLTVGFVSAGLLQFQNTLGIILGANIGTTITAQIIAFKITKASLILVALGFLINIVFKKKTFRELGNIILGLGLVFLGMNLMGEGTEPLKTYEPFLETMQNLANPLFGMLFGAAFTALIQSSSATTGIVIMLASQSLINIETGIALIIGANIGTCVTAILSALGKPRAAIQVALAHIIFNVIGAVIWLAFIPQLGNLVSNLTPNDLARQVANAHTVFNVANAFIFIGFTKPFAKLITWIIPNKKELKQKQIIPVLDNYYLEHVGLSLHLTHDALIKLGSYTLDILNNAFSIAISGTENDLKQLRKRDKLIDQGQTEVLLFLQKLEQQKLNKSEVHTLREQIETANILEAIADLITTDLIESATHRLELDFAVGKNTYIEINKLYSVAINVIENALKKNSDTSIDEYKINTEKAAFKKQLIQTRNYLISRLSDDNEERIAIYRFETEMLEITRRLHALARRLYRKEF